MRRELRLFAATTSCQVSLILTREDEMVSLSVCYVSLIKSSTPELIIRLSRTRTGLGFPKKSPKSTVSQHCQQVIKGFGVRQRG
jgi:hypothetical protein